MLNNPHFSGLQGVLSSVKGDDWVHQNMLVFDFKKGLFRHLTESFWSISPDGPFALKVNKCKQFR